MSEYFLTDLLWAWVVLTAKSDISDYSPAVRYEQELTDFCQVKYRRSRRDLFVGIACWYRSDLLNFVFTDRSDNIFSIFSEIILTDYEKEQLVNWEFQGAEYYIHTKKAEEKNTLEKRVGTLGDRY